MKALSIIGIVASSIGILVSIGVMTLRSGCSDCSGHPGEEFGLSSVIINLFFLAFSITSTVVSFRKKNKTQ
jgi:hypothetical protein